ncbi:MAG: PaaI family thioesterase [Anaerotardibacter sp.]
MPKLNPEHIKETLELINQGPYFRHLNMDIVALDMGYCRVEVEVQNHHLNAFGGIHGGAYASILDTCAYWALYSEMPEDAGFITLDLQTNNLRACSSGKLICEGSVIKRGGSICLCESKIHNEEGKLMAQCTSKMFVSPTLQPIAAAIDALDPTRKLPPKFLED